MRRRLLALLVAAVLATAGAGVLVQWVQGADDRALAGARTVERYVVVDPVPAGTPAADVAGSVELTAVPARLVADGALDTLAPLTGLVTTVDLQPGEQLLTARFASPESLLPPGTVPVPAGLQEVSVSLEAQRALGGRLAAGDTVGVFVSSQVLGATHLTLHKVLVTAVDTGADDVAGAPAGGGLAETAATTTTGGVTDGAVLVTLALSAADAEELVWAMEHGSVWLSAEAEDAVEDGTRTVTVEEVLS
ncbi:Flp pilus assembly protein CpaB [Modestobacter sp. Leaf380]|uniref:Flp pilus assembly protein CpaB n=1 Tax=Modestobacter sp. Leaf380 TaxID=1736356 RepID=UPI0006F9903F|nr:RcpC/CpaB family pilus assembly protein [Modestobacter sp. Leaf380]KQS66295.1 hypothetical protein ASG41_13370 [Modestobacter sp. Leaf380]